MPSLATALRAEVARLLEPLILAARVDEGWPLVLGLVGHTADAAHDPGLAAALADLSSAATAVEAIEDADLESWAGVQAVVDAADKATTALEKLQTTVSDSNLADRLEGLGEELTAQLAGVYLRRYRSRLFRLAAVLTLIDPAEAHDPQRPVIDGATLVRGSWSADALHFDRVGPLLRQPWTTLAAAYFPNDLATAADAHASAQLLFPLVGAALNELWLPWSAEQRLLAPPVPDPPDGTGADGDHFGTPEPADPPDPPAPPPPGDLDAFRLANVPRLTVRIPQLQADGSLAGSFLGLAVEASSAEHPGGVAGLIVELTGALDWTQTRGDWTLTAASQGDVPAFVVGPHGMSLAPAGAGPDAKVSLSAVRQPPSGGGPAFLYGPPDGTRLELGSVRAEADLALGMSAIDAALTVMASKSKLVLAPGDGDGFLQKVLPPNGFSAEFDLGVVVSSQRGVELKGGAGFEATLPVSVSLGPFGAVNAIVLAAAIQDGRIETRAGADLALRLGPIGITVDQIGIGTTISFPDSGGNLGPANFDVGFAGPKGIGIEIDAGIVSGGGYLGVIQDGYAGAFDLKIADVAVKAYGLVQTKLPGNVPGFSFVAVISAEFSPPFELSFGFTLDGVGGLLGVNRTIAEDAVESALWAHHLDGLLFPKDPIATAPQLISALQSYFPAAGGRYVFGPMAKIGWGEGMAVGDVALILELPEPLKLLLLGEVTVGVPVKHPQLELHVSFAGGLDLGKKLAFFDATLHDSRIAGYPISGDLAFRYGWGDQPVLAFSLGGFHPQFQPPANFPTLKRLAITIGSGVAQLETQAYIAITSNTLQFGARVELTAGSGSYNVHGWLAFDALCEKHPLSIAFDLSAGVDLRHGTSVLASVHLEGHLTGPTPWHISGEASLSLFFFDVTVHFDKTWGSIADVLATLDPLPELLAALTNRSSWTDALLPGWHVAVTTVAAPPDAGELVLLDPSGSLRIGQKAAPLGRPITRFGGAPLGRTVQFTIDDLTVFGGGAGQPRPTTEEFAPAQFFEFSDAEKLSLPSFSTFDAGVEVGHDAVDLGQSARTRAVVTPLVYDTTIVDSPTVRRRGAAYVLGAAALLALDGSAGGPQPGLDRYHPRPGVGPRVVLAPDRWVVAGSSDLALEAAVADDGSKLGAQIALAQYLSANPDKAGRLQVVLAGETT